jgi:hypothetical protein
LPKRIEDTRLFALARHGAEIRLSELVQEVKNIIGLFPHLRDSVDRDELPLPFIIARGAGRATKARTERLRRRGRMSAAARKAVSVRMKKYWAARRKATAKKT